MFLKIFLEAPEYFETFRVLIISDKMSVLMMRYHFSYSFFARFFKKKISGKPRQKSRTLFLLIIPIFKQIPLIFATLILRVLIFFIVGCIGVGGLDLMGW